VIRIIAADVTAAMEDAAGWRPIPPCSGPVHHVGRGVGSLAVVMFALASALPGTPRSMTYICRSLLRAGSSEHRNMKIEFQHVLFYIVASSALAVNQATAVVVEQVDIAHSNDTYTVFFDVVVNGPAERARGILTDYKQWPQLSKTIRDSRLVDTHADGRQRVSVTFRACILFIFCKDLRQVKDMETGSARASYRTELVPGEGDFASGKELWEILSQPDHTTRLRYRATLVLAFRLPPIIGPWLLKRQLYGELMVTAVRVEELLTQ
jgi:hypothetical protein